MKAIGYLFRLNEGGHLLVTTSEMEIMAHETSGQSFYQGKLTVSVAGPYQAIIIQRSKNPLYLHLLIR